MRRTTRGLQDSAETRHRARSERCHERPVAEPCPVARAQGKPSVSLTGVREGGRLRLSWFAQGAARFRLAMSVNGRSSRVRLDSTDLVSATHPLRPGRSYVFTLTALDATSAPSAFSIRG
jgi:hypothetical protein